MKIHSVNVYLIPSYDSHNSEYLAEAHKRRSFISGFDGSAGFAIVSDFRAALWTDGRYFLQAEKQLSKDWVLMKQDYADTPTKEKWLVDNFLDKEIGYDPKVTLINERKEYLLQNLKLKPVSNLVDKIWNDRPKLNLNPIEVLDLKFSGETFSSKIDRVRDALKGKSFVLTSLDEICWLFNLRGSDIPFNPVFFSYSLITKDSVTLYTDLSRVSSKVREYLKGVILKDYESIFEDLIHLNSKDVTKAEILVGESCNCAIEDAAGSVQVIKSPILEMKSIKNEIELDGFRNCHKRDAVALCRFFGWLEAELNKGTILNEVDAADKAESIRSTLEYYKGLSFETISSSGPNGSIIHYAPKKNTCRIVSKDEVFLFDSGAQYLDGTTDVTRTYFFGEKPDNFVSECFTRVLKGHIALAKAVFPEGTSGYRIDCLSRSSLWEVGLDYRHGTGHGVGHFLNVHEGPHGIGFRKSLDAIGLRAGVTVTNEPGYYQDGEFGIRIENVMLSKVVQPRFENRYGIQKWIGFESVTVVPLGLKLIQIELLNQVEIEWINDYHKKVRQEIGPLLEKDSVGYDWMIRETKPI